MSHSIRGALAGGGAWLAAAVLASCAAEPLPSPGWREAPPEVVALAAARGPLRAGAARVSADPPFAAPMAGYVGASWLRLREMRDPLFARALVLECGDLRVALVSVDRVLLPPELREAVERRAELRGAGIDGWIAGATHSHTAPGGFLAAWPAELLGMGAYDPLLLDHLAACVARAVAAAAAALEPVTIAAASGDAEAGLSFNRRDPAAPAGRRIDVLRFTRSGAGGIPASLARPAPVARLVSFAAHPTLIPFYLRRSSGDYPGVLCRELERSGGVALFAAGPCGDLAAGRPEDTPVAGWGRRVERIGRKLAARANELETRATALEAGAPRALGETGDVPLAYVRARVRLPPREPWGVPFAGAAIASFY
ncbi:MAG: hypothetical protein HY721_08465, partial [Planctomycetes bacterium]|nr:hypothetical protein [Planctomycetota bacterium]